MKVFKTFKVPQAAHPGDTFVRVQTKCMYCHCKLDITVPLALGEYLFGTKLGCYECTAYWPAVFEQLMDLDRHVLLMELEV